MTEQGIVGCGSWFIVELDYREPGYEARYGAREEPYRFRYRIYATTEEAAIRRAAAEFRRITAMSGVGWARDVVAVRCRRHHRASPRREHRMKR